MKENLSLSTNFFTESELHGLGLKNVGKKVLISRKASLYNPGNISIDDNSRIDDFCILSAGSGGIHIGKYIHIGCYSSLIGAGAIVMEDLSGLSGRVSIYSSNDDYSGNSITNPTVPAEFRKFISGDVIVRKYVAICCGSVVLPKVEIGTGAVIGAMSLVKEDCDEFCIYSGVPARKIAYRLKKILDFGKQIINAG
jgi:dTDP-4-amino-4,6-dideoxy-D-glucose acyltransferase